MAKQRWLRMNIACIYWNRVIFLQWNRLFLNSESIELFISDRYFFNYEFNVNWDHWIVFMYAWSRKSNSIRCSLDLQTGHQLMAMLSNNFINKDAIWFPWGKILLKVVSAGGLASYLLLVLQSRVRLKVFVTPFLRIDVDVAQWRTEEDPSSKRLTEGRKKLN
jgi:hypothetical protein